jgi:hypothetical protein
VIILRRVLRYAEKHFEIQDQLRGFTDTREKPRYSTSTVVGSLLVMVISRLGSLNMLDLVSPCGFWHKWLDVKKMPGADTMGRVCAMTPALQVRGVLKDAYRSLQRNKALLPPLKTNLIALVVDGHESSSSYLRCCDKCLKRNITVADGTKKTQYYHRFVMAVLSYKDFVLQLDLEMQEPGEDEVACALRLLKRVMREYPRAFDVVVADGLYAQGPFFKEVRRLSKHLIVVLKDDRRELYQDAMSRSQNQTPLVFSISNNEQWECWDLEGLESWPQSGESVRVVRCRITKTVRRQKDKTTQTVVTQWLWVTTIPKAQLDTRTFVQMARSRWEIENKAFNELCTHWHADHVYKHSRNAIELCWLMTMLAYNIFTVFFFRNLKGQLREADNRLFLRLLCLAELIIDHPALKDVQMADPD